MNQVNIEPTKFVNVRSGEESLGVRVYDDYGQGYVNTWESIPDDDMDVLKLVIESTDETIKGILSNVEEQEKGIIIGGQYYDWDEIKAHFE